MDTASSARRHVWTTGVGIVLALGLLLGGETAWAGTIYGWGGDDEGQVANTPAGDGFSAVAAGRYHSAALTPEPATFVLLAAGAVGLLGYSWKRRKRG